MKYKSQRNNIDQSLGHQEKTKFQGKSEIKQETTHRKGFKIKSMQDTMNF